MKFINFMQELKRISVVETTTGYDLIETKNGQISVIQSFPVIQPDTAGKTAKEKSDLYAEAAANARNPAMGRLWSDLFKKYNEQMGFENFTPRAVSDTEFIVYQKEGI